MSLSARRAWIEMLFLRQAASNAAVALRKESVDRNYKERPGQKARPKSLSARRAWIEIILDYFSGVMRQKSLSARRAWIEILTTVLHWYHISVALRKESVDRNNLPLQIRGPDIRRSPQGERG